MKSEDLYNPEKVNNPYICYYYASTSNCKIVYYEWDNCWKKRLRQISFSPREIDPIRCVLTFRKIASSFGELLPYEPSKKYDNGIYTYFKGAYKGNVTVLDMNSAYLFALTQPLADWETRTEVKAEDVFNKSYDYYCFENDLHRLMFYKEDQERMVGAMLWAGVRIYGYKASCHYLETAKELYRLKTQVNKERYKNVANIAVGCMHKHSEKQNNSTLAASLYAWFEWNIDNLVAKFEKKGYNVIMVSTDSVKIAGDYKEEDNIVTIGSELGEFKYEYKGPAEYYSSGHYSEKTEKWKGKPQYMIDGHKPCQFVNNIEKELEIYEKYFVL